MVPWIAEADQKVLFKDNVHFSTPQEQVHHCIVGYVSLKILLGALCSSRAGGSLMPDLLLE